MIPLGCVETRPRLHRHAPTCLLIQYSTASVRRQGVRGLLHYYQPPCNRLTCPPSAHASGGQKVTIVRSGTKHKAPLGEGRSPSPRFWRASAPPGCPPAHPLPALSVQLPGRSGPVSGRLAAWRGSPAAGLGLASSIFAGGLPVCGAPPVATQTDRPGSCRPAGAPAAANGPARPLVPRSLRPRASIDPGGPL